MSLSDVPNKRVSTITSKDLLDMLAEIPNYEEEERSSPDYQRRSMPRDSDTFFERSTLNTSLRTSLDSEKGVSSSESFRASLNANPDSNNNFNINTNINSNTNFKSNQDINKENANFTFSKKVPEDVPDLIDLNDSDGSTKLNTNLPTLDNMNASENLMDLNDFEDQSQLDNLNNSGNLSSFNKLNALDDLNELNELIPIKRPAHSNSYSHSSSSIPRINTQDLSNAHFELDPMRLLGVSTFVIDQGDSTNSNNNNNNNNKDTDASHRYNNDNTQRKRRTFAEAAYFGIRFDFSCKSKFLKPHYVILQQEEGEQLRQKKRRTNEDEDEVGTETETGKGKFRIYRHSLPVFIPIEQLEDTYLNTNIRVSF